MRKIGQKVSEKVLFAQPLGGRKRGRSRLRWRNEVDENARMFGIRNWWMVARDHDDWKGLL